MGYFSYLVKMSDKTMYELGKGSWLNTCRDEPKKKLELPLSDEIFCVNFSNKEEAINFCYQSIFDPRDELNHDWLADEIIKFCDGEEVWMTWDGSDDYHDLKNNYGFKSIGGRYPSFVADE